MDYLQLHTTKTKKILIQEIGQDNKIHKQN